MAERVQRPTPPESGTANDVTILFPDQTLEIRGETITVREYRYLEGLKVKAQARPLFEDLRGLIEAHADFAPEQFDDVIARHADLWVRLQAQACDREAAWVAGLSRDDGARLQAVFWSVNSFFFIKELRINVVVADAARRSNSRKSSLSSSGSGSDATSTTLPSG